jgi:hypothetical protein
MIGMRELVPRGNSMSITCSATLRPIPSLGDRCIRNPGAALTGLNTITVSALVF